MNAFRIKFHVFHAAAMLLALGVGDACAAVVLRERVQVNWAPDQQLSEVKDNPIRRGWLRPKDWEKSLGDYLRVRADRLLPAGQQLQIGIDDIKLAGSFEPWHGPAAQDIRFLKDIYPPRIDLHYKLLAADGSTIREGAGKLRDMAYLQHTVANTSDSLAYDKRMIDDWLRREFARNPL
jgi:hypothetical protein